MRYDIEIEDNTIVGIIDNEAILPHTITNYHELCDRLNEYENKLDDMLIKLDYLKENATSTMFIKLDLNNKRIQLFDGGTEIKP